MSRVCPAAVRRPRVGTEIPGTLHAPRGDLEQPAVERRRRPGHVPL